MSVTMDDRTANWVADHQTQSPLYSRIPFEIRQIIFNFVLDEYCANPEPHDFRLRHDHSSTSSSSFISARFTDGDGEDSELGDEADEADEADGADGADGAEYQGEEDRGLPGTSFLSWDPDDDDSDDSEDENYDAEPYYSSPDHSPERSTMPIPANRGSWLQPGCTGLYTTDIALLLTCRRSYLEAKDMVSANVVLRFWNGTTGKNTEYLKDWFDFGDFCERIPHYQMDRIVSAHMYSFLDNHGARLWVCASARLLRRIEHLRVTLTPPGRNTLGTLDPGSVRLYDPNATEIAEFGRGPPPPQSPDTAWLPPVDWGYNSWVTQYYQRFPSLKTLTIDFNARGEDRDKVGAEVDLAARIWRFPLRSPRSDGCTYLSAQGNRVELTSWRAALEGFGCLSCTGKPPTDRCGCAADNMYNLEKRTGPRIYMWTVKWTARVGKPWEFPTGMAALHLSSFRP